MAALPIANMFEDGSVLGGLVCLRLPPFLYGVTYKRLKISYLALFKRTKYPTYPVRTLCTCVLKWHVNTLASTVSTRELRQPRRRPRTRFLSGEEDRRLNGHLTAVITALRTCRPSRLEDARDRLQHSARRCVTTMVSARAWPCAPNSAFDNVPRRIHLGGGMKHASGPPGAPRLLRAIESLAYSPRPDGSKTSTENVAHLRRRLPGHPTQSKRCPRRNHPVVRGTPTRGLSLMASHLRGWMAGRGTHRVDRNVGIRVAERKPVMNLALRTSELLVNGGAPGKQDANRAGIDAIATG